MNKRPEYPRGVILTPEIIRRIRSDQEIWDKNHPEENKND